MKEENVCKFLAAGTPKVAPTLISKWNILLQKETCINVTHLKITWESFPLAIFAIIAKESVAVVSVKSSRHTDQGAVVEVAAASGDYHQPLTLYLPASIALCNGRSSVLCEHCCFCINRELIQGILKRLKRKSRLLLKRLLPWTDFRVNQLFQQLSLLLLNLCLQTGQNCPAVPIQQCPPEE
ncbi:40S ribosomal protein SA [Galemys pyrenaicus]|uniref:40S ribosomal protein SA n=1 Tax=Galemys pyrenaicus TaxID=202257 RepID=A0A8J6AFN5_GALPY|nr:40S ribosomal protein SA [Galemys pyrenaicus]